jgi:hypothetical protein
MFHEICNPTPTATPALTNFAVFFQVAASNKLVATNSCCRTRNLHVKFQLSHAYPLHSFGHLFSNNVLMILVMLRALLHVLLYLEMCHSHHNQRIISSQLCEQISSIVILCKACYKLHGNQSSALQLVMCN